MTIVISKSSPRKARVPVKGKIICLFSEVKMGEAIIRRFGYKFFHWCCDNEFTGWYNIPEYVCVFLSVTWVVWWLKNNPFTFFQHNHYRQKNKGQLIIIIIIIANFYMRFSHKAQSAYSVLLPRSLDTFQCRSYTVHNFHSPGSIPCLV